MGRHRLPHKYIRPSSKDQLTSTGFSLTRALAFFAVSVMLSCVAVSAPTFAGANALSKGPTLSQLETDLSLSASVSRAPNLSATVPPLGSDVSDGLTLPMKQPCYSVDQAALPSDPQTECLWGDKNGKNSIFLFGDSQAATWLAAMNLIGESEGYKVYFLAEASCPPWEPSGVKNFTLTTGLTFDECTKIISREIQFANKVHPALVVLAGDGNSSGTNQYNLSESSYVQEMTGVISRLKPSKAKIVLLSQVPQYNVSASNPMTPTECLTVHGSDMIPCLLNPDVVTESPVNEALVASSTSSQVALINVLPLFCTSERCPLVVWTSNGVYLTHYDQYHMDRFYSAFISHALLQLFLKKVTF